MEEVTLKFDNLKKVLNDFINDFMITYKTYLTRDGKKATGSLIKSIRNFDIQFENDTLVGKISLASYWKYVEYGRKRGKFPPPDAILSWIKMKPVIPRPMNSLKAPSEKQLAFLIGRKIAKEGIPAGNQFNEALNSSWDRYKDKISQAIDTDIQVTIDKF